MRVHVAVDQARHQRALAAIDHIGLRRLDRFGRHFLDDVVLDQHFVAGPRFLPARIEQAQVLEQKRHSSISEGCHPEAAGRGTFTDHQRSLAALGMTVVV
jgi:hypothetical protein